MSCQYCTECGEDRRKHQPNADGQSRNWGGQMPIIVLAIHEASGQDITFSEQAFSLVTGGGKPGQGYPCILIEVKDAVVHYERTDPEV